MLLNLRIINCHPLIKFRIFQKKTDSNNFSATNYLTNFLDFMHLFWNTDN